MILAGKNWGAWRKNLSNSLFIHTGLGVNPDLCTVKLVIICIIWFLLEYFMSYIAYFSLSELRIAISEDKIFYKPMCNLDMCVCLCNKYFFKVNTFSVQYIFIISSVYVCVCSGGGGWIHASSEWLMSPDLNFSWQWICKLSSGRWSHVFGWKFTACWMNLLPPSSGSHPRRQFHFSFSLN